MDLQSLNEELNHKINKYHCNSKINSNSNRINRPQLNCLIQQKLNILSNNSNSSSSNKTKSLYEEDFNEEITYENDDLDIFRVKKKKLNLKNG